MGVTKVSVESSCKPYAPCKLCIGIGGAYDLEAPCQNLSCPLPSALFAGLLCSSLLFATAAWAAASLGRPIVGRSGRIDGEV